MLRELLELKVLLYGLRKTRMLNVAVYYGVVVNMDLFQF
jgi:hypothetical protein